MTMRILCATDFSECSRRAIEHAATLARWNDGEVTLLHVYPLLVPMSADAPYLPIGLPLDEPTRTELLADLEAAAAPARAAGTKVTVMLVEGDPADEILTQARTLDADLAVLGTHGRRGFDRWILGSVAGRVVNKAHCPVLTVPRAPEHPSSAPRAMYERILCPVDLPHSEALVALALSIARKARARLTLLHVIEDLPPPFAALAPVDWATFHEDLERDARERLHHALPAQGADGCQVDEVVLTGKPHREILKLASVSGASLIVMGIHGRNPVDRFFFGSTAASVLRQADCPVLTVRRAEEGPS